MSLDIQILVVEDDLDRLQAVSRLLRSAGYAVIEASSGQEGLRLVQAHRPDLVLLARALPDLDGLEVCRRIKADVSLADTFVALVAAHQASGDSGSDGCAAGADDYVELPLSDREWVGRVQAMLRVQRAEAALRESQRAFSTLMGNLPGMGYRCRNDRDWTMEFVSEGCLELTGYAPADVIGNRKVSYAQVIHPDDREAVWENVQLAVRQNSRFQLTYRIITAAGQEKWVWEQGRAVFSPAGNLSALEGFITDISERVRAESQRDATLKALQESETRYRIVFELTSDYADGLRIEPDGALVREWTTEAFTRITGFRPDEIPARDGWKHIIHPDDFPIFRRRLANLLSGQQDVSEYRIITKGGQLRWLRAHGRPIWDEAAGRVVRYVAAVQDITERVQAEAALRESEERYRTLFEHANDAIHIANQNDELLDVNPRMCALMGYSREELLTMKIPDLQAPEMRGEAGNVIKSELARYGNASFEALNLHRDGRRIPIEISVARVAGPQGDLFISILRDITERKRAEQEIHRRNRELVLLNRIIAASVAQLEPEAVLETACRELALAFEVPQVAAALINAERTAGVVVAEYLAEGRPSALDGIIPLVRNPSFQYLLTHKVPLVVDDALGDPRLAPIHDLIRERGTVSMLILPLVIQGEVVGSLGIDAIEPRHFSAEEVTLAWSVADQVAGALARARLAQSQRRLITAIEQTAEGVLVTDTQGAILYVNPAFERISGYSQAEAVGQNPRILKSHKQDAAVYRELWDTISAGEIWHGRLINKKKDGALYTEETTITPVRDENGAIVSYVAVKRDVTQELRLEEQYRQAQKMQAVGQLTAGIAHDFNNMLTAINGFAELAQIELPPSDPAREHVGKTLDAGRRAANLVRQLLAFSRKQVIEPRVLHLNNVVINMEKILQRIIGEDIQLDSVLASDLGLVKADATQIEQVILNLAVNARDAMPAGGRLTIETANVVLDETYAATHLETQPGEYVLLAVSDTGVGMSQEVQTHLFEPFFTTKERGKGAGLGLATVYGIVKQSGGSIWVYSEVGMGSTFKIYLPRIQGALSPAARLGEGQELPSGSETILLVEDDAYVRELARYVLKGQGYMLLEAAGGQEALELAARHPGVIHLLLSDVVMPGMSGKALAEQLAKTRPGLKTLFISGYTDSIIAHHGVLDAGVSFLQKPFGPSELARKVRQVLDGPQPE